MYKKEIFQPASYEEVVGGDTKLDPLGSLPAQLAPDCHLENTFLRTLRAAPESEQYLYVRSEVIYNKVNRCLARYSPRATTTNRLTNRAPNKPAWPGPN